ncbi:MAG: hypothetical protein WBH96_07650, partial [Dysgonamonadaceae bacterium]
MNLMAFEIFLEFWAKVRIIFDLGERIFSNKSLMNFLAENSQSHDQWFSVVVPDSVIRLAVGSLIRVCCRR